MAGTRLLFFGPLRDVAGASTRHAEIPASVGTIDALIAWIAMDDPALAQAVNSPSVRVAIDQTLVDRTAAFAGAREIAFLPPFSGG